MTNIGTLASNRAAPIYLEKRIFTEPPTTQVSELHLIQLHVQACTSLREALRQMQAPTNAYGTRTWATATARDARGQSALSRPVPCPTSLRDKA